VPGERLSVKVPSCGRLIILITLESESGGGLLLGKGRERITMRSIRARMIILLTVALAALAVISGCSTSAKPQTLSTAPVSSATSSTAPSSANPTVLFFSQPG